MSMQAEDEHLKEGSPCPLCGEPLVIRHSAHGDFLQALRKYRRSVSRWKYPRSRCSGDCSSG